MRGNSNRHVNARNSLETAVKNATPKNSQTKGPLQVLIPVTVNSKSQNGLLYALRRQREGFAVSAVLLHVEEPVGLVTRLCNGRPWALDRYQSARAAGLFEALSAPFDASNVTYSCHFVEGDIVFCILDAAEQNGCDEIVLPPAKPWWSRFLSREIAPRVARRRRHIPIVTVDGARVPRQAYPTGGSAQYVATERVSQRKKTGN